MCPGTPDNVSSAHLVTVEASLQPRALTRDVQPPRQRPPGVREDLQHRGPHLLSLLPELKNLTPSFKLKMTFDLSPKQRGGER